MKYRLGAAAAMLALAGCSCAEPQMRTHSAALHAKECRKVASINAVSEDKQPGESWQVAKLLRTRVRDKDGKDVAQIEDLRLAPDGHISSITVSVSGAAGEKLVTIPFKELKRSTDRNGDYIVQTSFNLHPAGGGEKGGTPARAGTGEGQPETSPKDGKEPKK